MTVKTNIVVSRKIFFWWFFAMINNKSKFACLKIKFVVIWCKPYFYTKNIVYYEGIGQWTILTNVSDSILTFFLKKMMLGSEGDIEHFHMGEYFQSTLLSTPKIYSLSPYINEYKSLELEMSPTVVTYYKLKLASWLQLISDTFLLLFSFWDRIWEVLFQKSMDTKKSNLSIYILFTNIVGLFFGSFSVRSSTNEIPCTFNG